MTMPTANNKPSVPLIEATGVSVMAGTQALLEGIDLSLPRGAIVTLIGPNGAGKSTLVQLLLGLRQPDAGTIHRAPGIRIGYMPQTLALEAAPPMSVLRFLRLWGPRAHALAALAEVGAAALASRPFARLSVGERQRVLLARAVMGDPDLLILDEPAAGVDVSGQEEMFDLIVRLRDTHGCGVLLVSHDLHLVMARSDHVICLFRHVCCAGTPASLENHPELARLFGPYAPYIHRHDHRHDAVPAAPHGTEQ